MDTAPEVEANGKIYSFHESDHYPETSGELTDCYFIFYSMYFDNPDELLLRFFERDGGIIEIPLIMTRN